MIDSLREQQHTLQESFAIKSGFDPKPKNAMTQHTQNYQNIRVAFMSLVNF